MIRSMRLRSPGSTSSSGPIVLGMNFIHFGFASLTATLTVGVL